MGLLIFPQQETGTWVDQAHLILTYTMFLCSLLYQICNAACLAQYVYQEKRRRTLLNVSCILYFVFLTTSALYCVLKWRANQYYFEDEEGIKQMVSPTPHYEWISVFCMVLCYMGFCSYRTVLAMDEEEYSRSLAPKVELAVGKFECEL